MKDKKELISVREFIKQNDLNDDYIFTFNEDISFDDPFWKEFKLLTKEDFDYDCYDNVLVVDSDYDAWNNCWKLQIKRMTENKICRVKDLKNIHFAEKCIKCVDAITKKCVSATFDDNNEYSDWYVVSSYYDIATNYRVIGIVKPQASIQPIKEFVENCHRNDDSCKFEISYRSTSIPDCQCKWCSLKYDYIINGDQFDNVLVIDNEYVETNNCYMLTCVVCPYCTDEIDYLNHNETKGTIKKKEPVFDPTLIDGWNELTEIIGLCDARLHEINNLNISIDGVLYRRIQELAEKVQTGLVEKEHKNNNFVKQLSNEEIN